MKKRFMNLLGAAMLLGAAGATAAYVAAPAAQDDSAEAKAVSASWTFDGTNALPEAVLTPSDALTDGKITFGEGVAFKGKRTAKPSTGDLLMSTYIFGNNFEKAEDGTTDITDYSKCWMSYSVTPVEAVAPSKVSITWASIKHSSIHVKVSVKQGEKSEVLAEDVMPTRTDESNAEDKDLNKEYTVSYAVEGFEASKEPIVVTIDLIQTNAANREIGFYNVTIDAEVPAAVEPDPVEPDPVEPADPNKVVFDFAKGINDIAVVGTWAETTYKDDGTVQAWGHWQPLESVSKDGIVMTVSCTSTAAGSQPAVYSAANDAYTFRMYGSGTYTSTLYIAAPEGKVVTAVDATSTQGGEGAVATTEGSTVASTNTSFNWSNAEGVAKAELTFSKQFRITELIVTLADAAVEPDPVEPDPVETNVRTWDFTKWSAETVANLVEGADWSDIEKATDSEPTELSKENCFWQVKATEDLNADKYLMANGVVISELEGLVYTNTADRSLAIAVNYPTTSLGEYHGASYLWLGSKEKDYFLIPQVAPGSVIKMGVESHKPAEARGVKLYIGAGHEGTQLLGVDGEAVATPKTYEDQAWQVPADLEAATDIQIYNTNGCHIYYITVESPAGEEPVGPANSFAAPEGNLVAAFGLDNVENFGTAIYLGASVGTLEVDGAERAAYVLKGSFLGGGTITMTPEQGFKAGDVLTFKACYSADSDVEIGVNVLGFDADNNSTVLVDPAPAVANLMVQKELTTVTLTLDKDYDHINLVQTNKSTLVYIPYIAVVGERVAPAPEVVDFATLLPEDAFMPTPGTEIEELQRVDFTLESADALSVNKASEAKIQLVKVGETETVLAEVSVNDAVDWDSTEPQTYPNYDFAAYESNNGPVVGPEDGEGEGEVVAPATTYTAAVSVVFAAEEIKEAGSYKVVIPEGFFKSGDALIGAYEAAYTIAAGGEVPEEPKVVNFADYLVSGVEPEAGVVENINEVVFTLKHDKQIYANMFGGVNITLNRGEEVVATITGYDKFDAEDETMQNAPYYKTVYENALAEDGVTEEYYTTVTLKFTAEPVTEPGKYTVNIPENFFNAEMGMMKLSAYTVAYEIERVYNYPEVTGTDVQVNWNFDGTDALPTATYSVAGVFSASEMSFTDGVVNENKPRTANKGSDDAILMSSWNFAEAGQAAVFSATPAVEFVPTYASITWGCIKHGSAHFKVTASRGDEVQVLAEDVIPARVNESSDDANTQYTQTYRLEVFENTTDPVVIKAEVIQIDKSRSVGFAQVNLTGVVPEGVEIPGSLVEEVAADLEGAVIYDLNGREVKGQPAPGIYVAVKGDKAVKVVIR